MNRRTRTQISDHPLANPQVPGLRELASGIDALYLSGRANPSDELLERLEEAKQRANENDAPVDFLLAGVLFQLSPYSWLKYPYSLEHSYGRIGFRSSGRLPEVRVQTRAEALHGASPQSVFEFFDEIVTEEVGTVTWMVSRLDLYVDVQGWDLSPGMADRFVARSKQLTTYMDGELCTGFQFGTRKSKSISARLYDKTADMAKKRSDWIKDSWAERYNPALPVHRFELEFGRDAIKQFQVSTPSEVFAAVPDLWRYGTSDWLRLCVPTGDDTRSRWPLDPDWLVIQSASLRQAELGLARVRAKKGAAELAQNIPSLVGYLVTFAVLVGTISVTDTLRVLPKHIKAYEDRTGITFVDRVRRRRREKSFR